MPPLKNRTIGQYFGTVSSSPAPPSSASPVPSSTTNLPTPPARQSAKDPAKAPSNASNASNASSKAPVKAPAKSPASSKASAKSPAFSKAPAKSPASSKAPAKSPAPTKASSKSPAPAKDQLKLNAPSIVNRPSPARPHRSNETALAGKDGTSPAASQPFQSKASASACVPSSSPRSSPPRLSPVESSLNHTIPDSCPETSYRTAVDSPSKFSNSSPRKNNSTNVLPSLPLLGPSSSTIIPSSETADYSDLIENINFDTYDSDLDEPSSTHARNSTQLIDRESVAGSLSVGSRPRTPNQGLSESFDLDLLPSSSPVKSSSFNPDTLHLKQDLNLSGLSDLDSTPSSPRKFSPVKHAPLGLSKDSELSAVESAPPTSPSSKRSISKFSPELSDLVSPTPKKKIKYAEERASEDGSDSDDNINKSGPDDSSASGSGSGAESDSDDDITAMLARARARRENGTALLNPAATATYITPSADLVRKSTRIEAKKTAPTTQRAPHKNKLLASLTVGKGQFSFDALIQGENLRRLQREKFEADIRDVVDDEEDTILQDSSEAVLPPSADTNTLLNDTLRNTDLDQLVSSTSKALGSDDVSLTAVERKARRLEREQISELLKADKRLAGGSMDDELAAKHLRMRRAWDQEAFAPSLPNWYVAAAKCGDDPWKRSIATALSDAASGRSSFPPVGRVFSHLSGFGSHEAHIQVAGWLLSFISYPHSTSRSRDSAEQATALLIRLIDYTRSMRRTRRTRSHQTSHLLSIEQLRAAFASLSPTKRLFDLTWPLNSDDVIVDDYPSEAPIEVEGGEDSSSGGPHRRQLISVEDRQWALRRLLRLVRDVYATALSSSTQDSVSLFTWLLHVGIDPQSASAHGAVRDCVAALIDHPSLNGRSERDFLFKAIMKAFMDRPIDHRLGVLNLLPQGQRQSRIFRSWIAVGFLTVGNPTLERDEEVEEIVMSATDGDDEDWVAPLSSSKTIKSKSGLDFTRPPSFEPIVALLTKVRKDSIVIDDKLSAPFDEVGRAFSDEQVSEHVHVLAVAISNVGWDLLPSSSPLSSWASSTPSSSSSLFGNMTNMARSTNTQHLERREELKSLIEALKHFEGRIYHNIRTTNPSRLKLKNTVTRLMIAMEYQLDSSKTIGSLSSSFSSSLTSGGQTKLSFDFDSY